MRYSHPSSASNFPQNFHIHVSGTSFPFDFFFFVNFLLSILCTATFYLSVLLAWKARRDFYMLLESLSLPGKILWGLVGSRKQWVVGRNFIRFTWVKQGLQVPFPFHSDILFHKPTGSKCLAESYLLVRGHVAVSGLFCILMVLITEPLVLCHLLCGADKGDLSRSTKIIKFWTFKTSPD